MTKQLNISVDCGASSCKWAMENGMQGIVRTAVKETISEAGINVEYDGKSYIANDNSGKRSDRHSHTSKNHIDYKITTFYAIHKAIGKGGLYTINLCINVPVRDYISKSGRKEIIELYSGTHKVLVENQEYTLNIIPKLYHEGYGALCNNYEMISNCGTNTAIINLGSLNATVLMLDIDSEIITDNCDSLHDCSNWIIDTIGKELHRANHSKANSITKEALKQYITGEQTFRSMSNQQLFMEVATKVINQYLLKLEVHLNEQCKVDSEESLLIFCGGGSILFNQFLKQSFPYAEFDSNPVFTDVKGSLVMFEEE